ncbi:acyltransferase, partial [Mesorhizobium sp. M7A.F.Ca.CA.002.04.1.1]
FYAIYAACIACGLRGPLSPSMFIVVLVAMGQFIQSENVAWRFYTNPLMLEFVFGILLYLAYVHSAKLFVGRTWLMLAIFVATIAIRQMIPDLPWLLANGVPAVVLTAAALSWSPPRTRAITFLVLLGDASYSLYLSHPYVIQLASKLLPHQSGLMAQGLAGIVACALSIAVSIVLYTMIERPAQALFNGLAARRQASSTLRKTENHI